MKDDVSPEPATLLGLTLLWSEGCNSQLGSLRVVLFEIIIAANVLCHGAGDDVVELDCGAEANDKDQPAKGYSLSGSL